MVIMNPEDLVFPDEDAVFRFNPALDAEREIENRRVRRARRADRRQREIAAADTATYPPFPRKGQFTFNPHTPLFSHYPARLAVLLNEALDHPARMESIRHRMLTSKGFKKDSPFDTLFAIQPVYAITQRERLDEFLKAMREVTTLRGRLRRFLHRWRVSRLHKVNTDDIVTCEIPCRPVCIVDWKRKQVYVYEAATLAQDIRTRLLNHDGFFEEPQEPRNPLTNLPLTLAQNIAVWSQFCLYPNTLATVVSGFRHSRYSIDRFEQEFNTVLKLHALRTTLLDPMNADGNERIEEFIDHVYTSLNRVAPGSVPFRYWRSYCLRYYEADFLHINNPLMIRRTKADIIQEIVEEGLIESRQQGQRPVVIAPFPLRRADREHFFHFRVAPLGEGVPPVLPVLPAADEPMAAADDLLGAPHFGLIIDAPAAAPAPAPAPAAAPILLDDADTVITDEADEESESEAEEENVNPNENANVNVNVNVPVNPNAMPAAVDLQALLDAQFELEISLALALSLA
jgi:hypothetical protein